MACWLSFARFITRSNNRDAAREGVGETISLILALFGVNNSLMLMYLKYSSPLAYNKLDRKLSLTDTGQSCHKDSARLINGLMVNFANEFRAIRFLFFFTHSE